MKRLPILLTLFALAALSASIAYWVLQLYQPVQRPLASAAAPSPPPPAIDAAATLFGGQAAAALASNYQLTGVVAAGRESVAIIVADGGAPKALKLGREIAAGVTVKEVHPRYVVLSDGGVPKRIELAVENKAAANGAPVSPLPQPQQFQPPQQQPQPQPLPQPSLQPSMTGGPPPAAVPPPPPPPQMPPPTRGVNNPNNPNQLQ
jgi:general secretion pathway protein C